MSYRRFGQRSRQRGDIPRMLQQVRTNRLQDRLSTLCVMRPQSLDYVSTATVDVEVALDLEVEISKMFFTRS